MRTGYHGSIRRLEVVCGHEQDALAFSTVQSDPCPARHRRQRRQNHEHTAATAPDAQPKPAKKPNVGKRAGNVAPVSKKAGKKATPAKKAPEGRTKGKVAKPDARDGSKTAKILDRLNRPDGATAKELLKVTGWQPHSLRGFVSGTLGKKMGLTVTSSKGEDGVRIYCLKG